MTKHSVAIVSARRSLAVARYEMVSAVERCLGAIFKLSRETSSTTSPCRIVAVRRLTDITRNGTEQLWCNLSSPDA